MSKTIDDTIPPLRLRTRWALWRNGVLGSLRFQEWAAKVPVFRSIARRKAAAQFDLVAGFVYTQIVYVFVQTGLLGRLRQEPQTDRDITAFLGFSAEATDRLLRAGAALDIAESPQDGLWTLGQAGAALSANNGALAMVRHHALLYRDLADPIALLKDRSGQSSELSQFWTYASAAVPSEEGAAPYSDLMRATQPMVWQQILGRYPFGQHQRMLDIGGGSGAFVEAIGNSVPDLQLGLFDLPDVAPLARERFAGTKIEGRITIHPGSFRTESVPQGYDLVTLVRILHDHDDDVAQDLLRSIYAALPDGGRVLIVEPMAETRGAESMGDAYFGVYLWAMGSGRPRSAQENCSMLQTAGFSRIAQVSTPLPLIAKGLVATK